MTPRAFLFDLNGTMIDDMEYHAEAWYDIINNDLKGHLTMPQVRKEMYGKNSEVLVRIFGKRKFNPLRMDELSVEKEKRYQSAYRPHLKLIPGLDVFLEQAHTQKVAMGIGSAAIPFNIDFVLDNLHIRKYFDAIVSAEDVAISKPHPETFIKAAEILKVQPADCIVFEDAPKGVEAALNAGMKAIVLTTMHGPEEFTEYPNILFFAKDYHDGRFNDLFQS